jgi:demethylmenaquinone methyltransferase/2-methoxy-6-polyprenyl-1,4-benzoquinol methylase
MPEPNGMHTVARRLFRGLAASYDRTVEYATLFQDRYWKRWVAEQASLADGALVLDVGCGTLLLEERLGGSGCRYVGVDVTSEMARRGWSKGLANVLLLVNGDAVTLPFADETFDAAVSCYVPKYVSVARLAEELARVVKPGARVAFYDFARPRGTAALLLEPYIQVGLRAIGFALRRTGNGAAFAFEELPQIIDGTSWDREVVKSMEEEGFETLAATRLTAGAVFAYCGRKTLRGESAGPGVAKMIRGEA